MEGLSMRISVCKTNTFFKNGDFFIVILPKIDYFKCKGNHLLTFEWLTEAFIIRFKTN